MAVAKTTLMKNLEGRLNTDAALQKEFLKNPVAVLKREGVELSPDQEAAVRAQFKDVGVAKLPAAAKAKIHIGITITIRF